MWQDQTMPERPSPVRRLFATCTRGLEPALEQEVRGVPGARAVSRGAGGVAFEGSAETMARACLESRLAHRVLWTLGDFRARDNEDLYDGVRRLAPWAEIVGPDRTLAVWAAGTSDTMRDMRWVALKVKDAVVDAIRDVHGRRPSVDRHDPDVRIQVRMRGERFTVSLDAAGASLHARGWRTDSGPAPLRETLAAGMLALAGWDPSTPLVDPLCGSGTIGIEGALMATRTAPGLERAFGFERWPGQRPSWVASLRDEARARVSAAPAEIVCSDHDRGVVRVARDNAARAMVDHVVAFHVVDARQVGAPSGRPGLVAMNPPYGERLGEVQALVPFYEQLREMLRRGFRGWRVAILLAHEAHRDALALPDPQFFRLKQGQLDVRLAVADLPR